MADKFDVIIVGAGISGLYMLYRTRKLGLSARVIEMGADLGGTWYWNRYPGARCDTDTIEYSYSFDEDLQQEWEWPERYPTQPEILTYLNHVADRFDLRPDITFSTRVDSAIFDEAGNRWRVTTDAGAALSARFLIMATGCISEPNMPSIDGMETFARTDPPHRPLPPRGRRLQRVARRRHWHGLVRRAGDSGHRPAGCASDSLSALAAVVCSSA